MTLSRGARAAEGRAPVLDELAAPLGAAGTPSEGKAMDGRPLKLAPPGPCGRGKRWKSQETCKIACWSHEIGRASASEEKRVWLGVFVPEALGLAFDP